MTLSITWTRRVAAGLAVLMALTVAAPVASAGERVPSARTSSSLAARAAATVATLKPTSRALAQADSTTSTGSDKSFFHSPTGIAAAILMIAGAGFVAVSIRHDNKKVHSPIR